MRVRTRHVLPVLEPPRLPRLDRRQPGPDPRADRRPDAPEPLTADGGEQKSLDEQEQEQAELVRPPDVNRDSNRTATRLELFFDLAFILFVARCADGLAAGTATAAAVFAGVLTVGWWSWASSALYANRFDTDDVLFRLFTLTGMSGVVVMAATVDDVGGPGGRWFAAGYLIARAGLVAGYLRAWWHVPRARPGIRPYLVGHLLGGACWAASIAVPGPARYVLWGVGVLVDLAGPTLAARRDDQVPLHVEHLPERFALFVILVLGETVAGVVVGLHDGGMRPAVVGAAALALVIAFGLWWLYFDLAGGSAKRELLEEGEDPRQGVHDVYLYLHLPIAIALAAVAAGVEDAVLHAGADHLEAPTRWILAIGLAGYLLSAGTIEAVMSRGARGPLLWPGAGIPVVLLLAWLDPRPHLLLAGLGAVLVLGLAVGIAEHRAGWVRTAKV
jgi:low temperature requirement protein LtrA